MGSPTSIKTPGESASRENKQALRYEQVLGHNGSLAYEAWPEWVEDFLVSNTYQLPVQVGV